jgi:hypothetical protein
MERVLMQINIKGNAVRCDPNDPESRLKLNGLLWEFGYSLVENASEMCGPLIENIVWRRAVPAGQSDGDVSLQVFLDLGDGDEILLATIRAGEISTFSHAL